MSKPTGLQVAQKAIELFKIGFTYAQMDCQDFIEESINQAGGNAAYAGTNDMARNAVSWLGTIDNARAEGKLVPGAILLIHNEDESDLPAKYRGDGLGNFDHGAVYIGDKLAVKDYAKGAIFNRVCDAIHSSQSQKRVAGTTIQNGYTHVAWFKDIDYGEDVIPGVTIGVGIEIDGPPYDEEGLENENAPAEGTYTSVPATVYAKNGKPVKLRSEPSLSSKLYWLREVGTVVEVLEQGSVWCKVRSRSRVGYMKTEFLVF